MVTWKPHGEDGRRETKVTWKPHGEDGRRETKGTWVLNLNYNLSKNWPVLKNTSFRLYEVTSVTFGVIEAEVILTKQRKSQGDDKK